MENRQGYDPSEFEDDDYMNPQPAADKSIRGYRIVIIILSAILVALSVLYYSIHRQQMIDNELLQADRDSIQNDLGRLMTDYDNLQISNDSISANLTLERERADSLMTRLKKERSWIERKGPGCKPKYCDACRAERRRASQRKTYHKKEEQRKAQEAMHKLAPARSLSMNELLRELDQFNAKRRQMGLAPVSYGRYVAFRDKYIKEI